MKLNLERHTELIDRSRAPQGARGLKFRKIGHVCIKALVAPRKGRVG